MSREWRESIAEFTTVAAEGIRQCLVLAEDLKEVCGESVEDVREQLLAIVKLDREARHLEAAMQHVEAMAASVHGAESEEQGPPELMDEMESKMTLLIKEDETFNPTTHPSAQEFNEILTRNDNRESQGEEAMDEDVQVGKVQVSLKCPLTGCYLEDPVSNPECGHTYSKAAVTRHVNIQLRVGSAAKCPVCSGPLSTDSLKPEPSLADKVRRAQRRRSRRSQDSIVAL